MVHQYVRLSLFVSSFAFFGTGFSTQMEAQDSPLKEVKSKEKETLDNVRQSMFSGGRVEQKAAVQLNELDRAKLTSSEKELWLRLAREAAIRLGDRTWIESLKEETDSFESAMIYRVLLASGEMEKGNFQEASEILDKLGDLKGINEREKRRVYAIRARLAQLNGETPREREFVEKLVDHLHYWPTENCQSCHNIPSDPKVITSMPIQRLWFGERFVELMKEQKDAEKVKAASEKELAADASDDRARIRLAYANLALGDSSKAEKLFRELPWAQVEGRDTKKPRMMTTFP